MTELIKGTNISHSFGQREILSKVNITIRKGEVVTIIGPNGSGKSTLIKILLGLFKPTSGKVKAKKSINIGYMPQHLTIDQVLPITVERFLKLRANKSNLDDEQLTAIYEKASITHLLELPMATLSGGEKQRVLLARALSQNPDVLVLDEPLQGMDLRGQAEFYEFIETVRKENKLAVVLISHDLHMVMANTDHVVCMNRHVCCEGHPEDVSQHPEYLALFGKPELENIALYKHHHDHEHSFSGDIVTNDEADKC